MTRWGRALLLALLIITLIAPLSATAQTATPASATPAAAAPAGGAPVIASAELRLWPEYDDPGLLVIFSGNFSEGTAFPLQAAFPISAGARNVQATYQDATGNLINRPFEVTNDTLTYELPSGGFHFEYYVDRAPSGNDRQIKYVFQAPYAITALRVTAQQPARATGFTLAPAAETTQQGTDGLTYHVFNRSNVAAGEKLEITLSYTKADASLTAPFAAATAAAPAAQPAPAAAATTDWLPWVLIGAGVALAVGLLAYWLITRRPAEAATAAKPARASQPAPRPPAKPLPTVPARPADAPKPSGAAAFCSQCGNALKPEDRFCAQCGAPRRS